MAPHACREWQPTNAGRTEAPIRLASTLNCESVRRTSGAIRCAADPGTLINNRIVFSRFDCGKPPGSCYHQDSLIHGQAFVLTIDRTTLPANVPTWRIR